MKLSSKTKNIIAMILNFADMIFMISCLPIFTGFSTPEGGTMAFTEGFKYFTIDSNILMAGACNVMVVFNIRALKGKPIPKWATLLKFAATSGVALTFLTVVLFLGPVNGLSKMFTGSNFWMHLICPLICMISFMFFEPGKKISFKETVIGMIPMLIYGAVYGIMVYGLKVWNDAYNFNIFGMWYVFFVIMILAGFGISAVLRLVRGRFVNEE